MSLATGGIGRPVALGTTRGLGRKVASAAHRTALATGGLGAPVGLLATRGLGRRPVAAASLPHRTTTATGGLGSPVAMLSTRGLGRDVAGEPIIDRYPGGGPEASETYRAPWARRRTALHAGQMYAPAVYREMEEAWAKKRTPEAEKRGERIVFDVGGAEIEVRPSKGPTLSRELRARAKPDVLLAIMAELDVTEKIARERLRERIKREREALNAWRQELIDDEELLLLLMVI